MKPGLILQLLSSFPVAPVEPSLLGALAKANISAGVGFTPREQMREYMLAPASDTEHIIGSVVILRVEDWLGDAPDGSVQGKEELRAREELKNRVREFVSELTILSYRGKPVWFLPCPVSAGISAHLASLCQTYTNLLLARVRNVPQVKLLHWPAALSNSDEHTTAPPDGGTLSQKAFDRLGESIGVEVARTLASDSKPTQTVSGQSRELAAYLAELQVEVELSPANGGTRAHVDRILRTAASFSLTGEKPEISDADIDAILKAEFCILVSVSDRLADHGPSGVIVGRWQEDALAIEWWSLSCTVLGKQVEYALLSALARMAGERHCSKLIFAYQASGRNQTMLNFLQSMADATDAGFVLTVEGSQAGINAAAVNPGAWSVRVCELRKSAATEP